MPGQLCVMVTWINFKYHVTKQKYVEMMRSLQVYTTSITRNAASVSQGLSRTGVRYWHLHNHACLVFPW